MEALNFFIYFFEVCLVICIGGLLRAIYKLIKNN